MAGWPYMRLLEMDWPCVWLFSGGVAVYYVPSVQCIHRRVAPVLDVVGGEVQNEEHEQMHRPEIDDDKTEKKKKKKKKRKEEMSLEFIEL